MGMFRATWVLLRRHSAYCCATVLVVCAIALLAASLGTVWYKSNMHGLVHINNGSVIPEECYFKYSVEEYSFHLEIDINGHTTSCDYADGECKRVAPGYCTSGLEIPVTLKLDGRIKAMYGALFAWVIITFPILILAGIFLQVVCWAKKFIHPIATLVLVIITITLVCFACATQLIAWSILFNHPEASQDSISSGSHCPGGDSNHQERGGFLCTWNGDYQFGEFDVQVHRWLGWQFRDLQMSWGPSTAWVLLTIAFGLTVFVFLLTVGWRPPFRRDGM